MNDRSGGHLGSGGTQGSTPLLFFAGNAKLKPFVPSTEQRGGPSSNKKPKGQKVYSGSKSEFGESMMKRARKDDFAFL